MSYISISFLAFVTLCFGIYYFVPNKYRIYVLLSASVVFYLIFSKYLIVASAGLTLIIYFISLKISRIDEQFNFKKKELSKDERKTEKNRIKKTKKRLCTIECIVAFSILITFKYLGFFTETINYLLSSLSIDNISFVSLLIPIGISYYTLSVVAYAVDVYRGSIKAEKNFAKLYLYTIYFPQIVEGPIGNYQMFSSQINTQYKINYEDFMGSFERVLLGLVKKMVLADRAGIIANHFFDNYNEYNSITTVFGMIMYAVNIYFDFSGCMDIVCGVSSLFGINLPENFRQPFFSKNIQEFWRRWHITLGDWIKKYVFYSVSMSRLNQKFMKRCNNSIKSVYYKTTLPMLFSLFFVWLFNGIWHGASWKYVLYGLYYYIILSLGMLFNPLFEKLYLKLRINCKSKALEFFRIFRTTLLVTVGLTLFRAESVFSFFRIITSLTNINSPFSNIIAFYDSCELSLLDIGAILFFIVVMIFISVKKENEFDFKKWLSENPTARWIICTFMVLIIVLFGVYGSSYTAQPFVYAQF